MTGRSGTWEGDALPMQALRDTGLLWLINATVFHPRGFAMGISSDGRWGIHGDGTEPWQFAPGVVTSDGRTIDDCFRAAEAFLDNLPTQGPDMSRTLRSWIIIRNGEELRLVKGRPQLAANEVAIEVVVNCPQPPRIVGTITIDLPDPPPVRASSEVVEYGPDEESPATP